MDSDHQGGPLSQPNVEFMMTKKHKYVLFWLRSSRGTDEMTVREYTRPVTKEQIKDDLEEWCSRHAAWQVSESYCTYGFKFVKAETRAILLKRWTKLCASRERIDRRWRELRAKLNPVKIK